MMAAMNPSPPAESSFIVNYLGQKSFNRKGRKGDNPTGVPLRSLPPFFASFAVKLFDF
jgi:hypothetical protein